MIKTLRITSIAAAALAVVFLVSSVVFGVRGNSDIEEFLNSPSVVDMFKQAGNKTTNNAGQGPLVEQAGVFAKYLNPPAPIVPTTPRQISREVAPVAPPIQSTPKFRLIGISYYEAKPEESLAFVDEVGKGAHWVRPSTKLGHITIEAVKEDAIVVNDGSKTYELTPDSAPAAPVAAMIPTGIPDATAAISGVKTATTPGRVPPTVPTRTTARTASRAATPPVDPERAAKMEEFVSRLKDMQKSLNTEKTGSPAVGEEDRATQVQAMMAQMMASRVSEDEAKELDDLGKQLNEEEAPGTPPSVAPATRIPARPAVTRPPRNMSGRG